ncbi:NEQ090 [Nanoarchaeum equitans Kin4-M]|uniref:NEQ090 n=1 Tax=Nanoarchaeum equitans (strain Kin4-M) TaxID=228908 RepID=Q74N83_NANEQ|nr:NEQ090 [Nanoarchaeum equitans Kin4-M]
MKILNNLINEKLGTLISTLIYSAITIILARRLDSNSFGLFVIFTSLTMTYALLINLGTAQQIIKYKDTKYYGIILAGIIIFLPIFLGLYYFLQSLISDPIIYLLLVLDSIFLAFIMTLRANLIANYQYDLYSISMLLDAILKLIISLFSRNIFLDWVITDFLIASALFIYIKPKITVKNLTKSELYHLISYNLINLAKNTYYITDTMIVGFLLSLKDAGIYKLVSQTIEALLNIFNARNVLAPAIRDLNWKDSLKLLGKTIFYHSLIAIIFAIAFILLGKKVIVLLLGKQYEIVYDLTLIALPIVFLDSLSYINVLFEYKGFPHLSAIALWISLIVNIFFDLILIPKYSIKGAIIATILSYASAILFGLFSYLFYVFPQIKAKLKKIYKEKLK